MPGKHTPPVAQQERLRRHGWVAESASYPRSQSLSALALAARIAPTTITAAIGGSQEARGPCLSALAPAENAANVTLP